MMQNPGDLRVWWMPQVPGKALYIPVENLHQAHLILQTLAIYDAFQYAGNIKGDYCNAGGLEILDDDGWSDWSDDNTGQNFYNYADENFEPIFSRNFEDKLWQCIRLKDSFHNGK